MGKKILKYAGRTLLVILVTLVMLFFILYAVMHKIANGSSQAARDSFVTTILETGQMKFLASWVCSKDEINEIQERNKLKEMDVDQDMSKITIKTDTDDEGFPQVPAFIKVITTMLAACASFLTVWVGIRRM